MRKPKGPDFEEAKRYVFGRMERELSPNLFYHGIHHTRDDVLPAFEMLAKIEGITRKDLLVGKTAALYHDIGFIEQYLKNEPVGVRIASDTLPSFGYSPDHIEQVGQVIMATQLHMIEGRLMQVPDKEEILQMLMCDADLNALGRDDWFSVNESYRRELIKYSMPHTPRQWAVGSLAFQENHSYFTDAAKTLRNPGKQKNIRELKELLGII